jgi:hypothetical protein
VLARRLGCYIETGDVSSQPSAGVINSRESRAVASVLRLPVAARAARCYIA